MNSGPQKMDNSSGNSGFIFHHEKSKQQYQEVIGQLQKVLEQKQVVLEQTQQQLEVLEQPQQQQEILEQPHQRLLEQQQEIFEQQNDVLQEHQKQVGLEQHHHNLLQTPQELEEQQKQDHLLGHPEKISASDMMTTILIPKYSKRSDPPKVIYFTEVYQPTQEDMTVLGECLRYDQNKQESQESNNIYTICNLDTALKNKTIEKPPESILYMPLDLSKNSNQQINKSQRPWTLHYKIIYKKTNGQYEKIGIETETCDLPDEAAGPQKTSSQKTSSQKGQSDGPQRKDCNTNRYYKLLILLAFVICLVPVVMIGIQKLQETIGYSYQNTICSQQKNSSLQNEKCDAKSRPLQEYVFAGKTKGVGKEPPQQQSLPDRQDAMIKDKKKNVIKKNHKMAGIIPTQKQFEPTRREIINHCGDVIMFSIYVNSFVLSLFHWPLQLFNIWVYIAMTITGVIMKVVLNYSHGKFS